METHTLPSGFARRREDVRLITGGAHYIDDIKSQGGRPQVLSMAVVRSPYAHAKILSIDLEEALAVPGVVAAFAGADIVQSMPSVRGLPQPDLKVPEHRLLAVDRVRYVGDPVAVVLAENIYAAIDARDLISVDYEPLAAVVDPEAALADGAPLLYEDIESNVALHTIHSGGDIEAAFSQARHTVSLRLVNQRVSAAPMEPRACLFDFNAASGELTAWVSSQAVYRCRDMLANFLSLPPEKITVYNAEVGGGFGTKTLFLGEEVVAAALAVRYARPIKWIEDRSENLQAQTHGRGQVSYVEAAFQDDGRLLGLKVRILSDFGAFLAGATALVPNVTMSSINGPYMPQAIECEILGILTNKVPTSAYRGAGRPEATYILERVMERIGSELQLDPVEVRRRNFISPTAFPYQTPLGMRYDSGNYEAALDRALELVDYQGWRVKQQESRAEHKLVGIGISTFTEMSGGGAIPGTPQEAATVRICRDGNILVQSAVAHNGQGHFTAFAQIAAQVFQLPGERVEVKLNDTRQPSFSIGTFGSRVTQTAGSAVLLAAQAAREKALSLAAHILEAAPTDLLLQDGVVSVRGVPARTISLAELARTAEEQPDLIEHEAPNPANGVAIEGLAAWRSFSSEGPSFSSGTHIAVVEIDRETGEIAIPRYVAVDDCGRILNSYLADMQVHGSLAQGIGQALFEGVVYDEQGQNLTSTLMDYALPIASQMPSFTTAEVETPSPLNPLGAKGVGESGCTAAPPAIVNAVLDALAPLGVTAVDMPLTPARVWSLIQSA